MSTLKQFNKANQEEIKKNLAHCNASKKWVNSMMSKMPFDSVEQMMQLNEEMAQTLEHHDWLDAFLAHPKIGEKKPAPDNDKIHQQWSNEEQKSINFAQQQTRDALDQYNQRYYEKFGFIFIICATGKSAVAMLEAIKLRINNSVSEEIQNAAKEQIIITNIRIKKLIDEKSNNNTYS